MVSHRKFVKVLISSPQGKKSSSEVAKAVERNLAPFRSELLNGDVQFMKVNPNFVK
jgi:hypothetical protein